MLPQNDDGASEEVIIVDNPQPAAAQKKTSTGQVK